MTQYRVFTHPSGAREAVKQGWSWPAFFFTYIWAFCKRQYGLGASVLIGAILIGGAMGATGLTNEGVMIAQLFSLVLSIVFGLYGNRWRERNLLKRGYEDGGYIGADNSDKAVSAFLKTAREQHV